MYALLNKSEVKMAVYWPSSFLRVYAEIEDAFVREVTPNWASLPERTVVWRD